jgi:UDP:flavonoid glycosyltransferase YjiC (YdhE family)
VPFVRGDLAARRAAIVVTNGGSSTGYQALAAGAPVVGLPFNLDQYLAMEAIERSGAGLSLRSGLATAESVAAAVDRALRDPALRSAAHRAALAMAALDPHAELRRLIDEWFPS